MQLLEVKTPLDKKQLQIPPLDHLSFPLLLDSIQLPQGNLNFIRVYTDPQGRRCLLRLENPEGRLKELPFITAELTNVGFVDGKNNGFRIRSPQEQALIAKKLTALGISTPFIHYVTPEILLTAYHADTINQADLWQTDPDRAIKTTREILSQLCKIHSHNLKLGDRWGKNELIHPDNSVSFVDFDIELFGPKSKEFELAMFLFFNAYFAQLNPEVRLTEVLEVYKDFLSSLRGHSMEQVKAFILNFSAYFVEGTLYAWRNQADVKKLREIVC